MGKKKCAYIEAEREREKREREMTRNRAGIYKWWLV